MFVSTLKTRKTVSFCELPKTDNTYSPSSKFYGCTLAPGIPLIPNLCRRPLRSPGSGAFDYTFSSFTEVSEEADANHHNSWREKNSFTTDGKHNNGFSNHFGQTKLTPTRSDFQDSGLDSDSDFEDGQYRQVSQNTVTWFRWIITTVTTVVTIIRETVVGKQSPQNHVNTRVPLKHYGGVSWYQYPVMWLYQLALLVQRADTWILSKIHSILRVNSWGTPEQRRKWTLIILLIPLLIWAGLFIADYSFPSSETLQKVFNTSTWESAMFSPVESII